MNSSATDGVQLSDSDCPLGIGWQGEVCFCSAGTCAKCRATNGVEEPDTMSDANYYAHRIERALDDFPNDEHVPLHRDFLADAAKWLRYASGVITDAGRAALSSADAAGVEGKKR